jgi:hypothetical protein
MLSTPRIREVGLIQRHESLRTTFEIYDNEPAQIVHAEATVALTRSDLPAVDRHCEEKLINLLQRNTTEPFDLEHGPLFKVHIIQIADDGHVLALNMHHIVSDGWSMGVMLRELAALYHAHLTGAPDPLPELPIQYADYSVWQRDWLQGDNLDNQLAYWKKQLDDLATLQLPLDHPRPHTQTYRGARQIGELSAPLVQALKALCQREGVTLFMTLLAAFQTLLSRYCGQDDIAVGAPIAGRNRQETEGLIGFFVNTLVLRADLSGNPSFRELLARVRQLTLDAYDHQDIPFEKLVEELHPERNPSLSPLFQVMFALQNDAGTIERMLGHFQTLLEGIVRDPDQRVANLPLLTETEKHQLLVERNLTTSTNFRVGH